jgi:protein SCO1
MKKTSAFTKVIIIAAILLLPSVFFLFISSGKNNYKELEIFGPKIPRISGDTLYHTIPAFTFQNFDGTEVSDKTFENKIYVADFFFTSCPSICPKMSHQMHRVQKEFEDKDDVKLISFTVDPDKDDIETLAAYAEEYNAIPGKWFFVTGSKPALYDLARTGFFLTAIPGDGGPEDFIHSEMLVLVDKEKRIRGYYDGTDPYEVKKLIEEIKVLQSHYKRIANAG